jgi:hypothetical protein
MHAPKVNRRYLYLGAGLLTPIIACMVITLIGPAVRSAAVADRQRSKLSELTQARALWEARPFSRYRLILHLQPSGGSVCEKAFEADEPAQTKPLSDTCAAVYDFYLMKFLGSRRSVTGLFDYIEAEIGRLGECGANGCACDGGRTIDVVYDTALGYPKKVETRLEKDWTTRGLYLGCTVMGNSLPSPVTVTVNPIE